MVEMVGEIESFDMCEITKFEIISSKKVLEILKSNPKIFDTQKYSYKEKLITFGITELQKKYNVQ
jgi:hypothetical protein